MPGGAPAGYTGMMTLGKAVFTLGIDDSEYKTKIIEAENRSVEAAAKIERAFHHSGRGAAQGLLAVGQAVDDLQYGFKAIVNNIPQIVYMMGGGAGLAGAVGILAVAANQLSNHWEALTKLFGNTAPFEVMKGALIEFRDMLKEIDEQLKKGTASADTKIIDVMLYGEARRGLESLIPAWEKATEAAKRHTEAVKETEEAIKKVHGVTSEAAEKRGKLFDEAIKQSGGGDTVATDMAKHQLAAMGAGRFTKERAKEAQKEAMEEANRLLARGMAGEDIGNALPAGVRSKLEGLRHAEIEKDELKRDAGEAKAYEHRKEMEKKAHAEAVKDFKEVEHLAHEIDRKRTGQRVNALQDQEQLINKQKHMMSEAEWERTHNQPRNAQVLAGAKSAIDLYQTSGSNQQKELAMKAHRLQEEANKKLEKIRDAIEKERRGLVLRQ